MTKIIQLSNKLKTILKDKFNTQSKVLITNPFFKLNSIGLRKDELETGVYLFLIGREDKPLFDANVYYFPPTNNFEKISSLYNVQYDKYMFPLWKLGDYTAIINLKYYENSFKDKITM
jgi:hypothetical protein